MKKQSLFLVLALMLSPMLANADTWYSEYDAALEAIAARDWSSAQTKLKLCMNFRPQQGRRVFAYGIRFIKYVPQYYLGVISFHQGKYQDALNQFQQTEKAGLVIAGDPEYGEMIKMQQTAVARLKPLTEETAPPAALPTPVIEKPLPQPLEVINQDQVATPETEKPAQLKEQPADPEMQQEPVIEKNSTETEIQDLENGGLLAFFSGDYARAVNLFERLTAAKKATAESWFYIACSHAALGLLQGKQGDAFLQKARREFARAHQLNPKLKYFPDLISPRILEIYRQATQ